MKKNLLEKYKSTLEKLKEDKKIDKIIIFGSYATGKIKPLSDLDIAIIPKNPEYEDYLCEGTDELDISNFYKLPLSLQYKIITKGKIYHEKSKSNSLKHRIMNQWFDFRETLNKIYLKKGYPKII
ncbi:MAG: nucleotidyltransferase domain-containing protein [Nanoarchaeota archaeon]